MHPRAGRSWTLVGSIEGGYTENHGDYTIVGGSRTVSTGKEQVRGAAEYQFGYAMADHLGSDQQSTSVVGGFEDSFTDSLDIAAGQRAGKMSYTSSQYDVLSATRSQTFSHGSSLIQFQARQSASNRSEEEYSGQSFARDWHAAENLGTSLLATTTIAGITVTLSDVDSSSFSASGQTTPSGASGVGVRSTSSTAWDSLSGTAETTTSAAAGPIGEVYADLAPIAPPEPIFKSNDGYDSFLPGPYLLAWDKAAPASVKHQSLHDRLIGRMPGRERLGLDELRRKANRPLDKTAEIVSRGADPDDTREDVRSTYALVAGRVRDAVRGQTIRSSDDLDAIRELFERLLGLAPAEPQRIHRRPPAASIIPSLDDMDPDRANRLNAPIGDFFDLHSRGVLPNYIGELPKKIYKYILYGIESFKTFWGTEEPLWAYIFRTEADEYGKRFRDPGLSGYNPKDIENAARHAYWMAKLAAMIGAKDARAAGDIHERVSSEDPIDSKIDDWNNEIGRRIGLIAHEWAKRDFPLDYEKYFKHYVDILIRKAMREGAFILDKNDPRIGHMPSDDYWNPNKRPWTDRLDR